MSGERLLRILTILSASGEGGEAPRLCEVAAQAIGMSGAGIMVFDGDLPRGTVCTTDPVSALIEDLQHTLGEGPCVDAHTLGEPVSEADLAAPAVPRWPAFGPPAVTKGARAVFGFPVRIGAIRIGALNLYRDQPGTLSDDQHADALVMADVAARAILSLQADAPPGGLAVELEAGADFHFVVHQAAGMVSIQLDISVTEALLRLRAHAFATETPLAEVAQDVVDRQLRFADPPTPDRP
ncbi:MAG: GAF and ANTAR domain-containing protein [Acidimicrobiales bacterium]